MVSLACNQLHLEKEKEKCPRCQGYIPKGLHCGSEECPMREKKQDEEA